MTQGLVERQAETVMSRFEQKLVVPPQSAGFVVAWLHHTCIADPVYPLNLITSLYFDTPELDSYYECLDGDIYKNKVRIRWYDQPPPDQDVPAYIELKSKRGFNTVKRRKEVKVPGSVLQDGKVAGIVSQSELERALPELGYVPRKQLRPLIVISYRRYRFWERQTGLSLTYDLGIASWMVERSIAIWAPRLELQTTVLELKGGAMALPPVFRGLQSIAPRWSAFSKYAKCLESHLEQPGSTGWLKP